MNERDNKKEHELWFKNKYPDDYLLFIHDASREALIKYVNSEEVWLASANREGYKLVPIDELKRIARETESYYTCRDIEELIGAVDGH